MWSNAEEVLNDLARFTGRNQRCLDRNYVVVGHNPPPPARYMEVDDDEFTLRFGHNAKSVLDDDNVEPDLRGIQDMLQLVREPNDADDDLIESLNEPGSTIVISKLNPNVKEFVPKIATPKLEDTDKTVVENSETSKENDSHAMNSKNDSSLCNEKESSHGTSNDSIITKSTVLSEAEIKTKAELLKRTICNTADTDSYKAKREKNLAISSLLKLYTLSPSAINSQVKLMTPEEFAKPKTDKENAPIPKPEENLSNDDQKTDKVAVSNENGVPLDRKLVSNREKLSIVKQESSISNNISEISKPGEINNEINSFVANTAEVKKSIQKVTDWLEPKVLNEKCKEIKKPINLGPVVFKRKEPSKSPTTTVKAKSNVPDQTYKPSQYANDLIKKYESKLKVHEEELKKPTWNNLDIVLKMKDEEIRKLKSANASNSSSTARLTESGSSETL